MPRISEEPLVRYQVRLFERDVKRLRELYGQQFGVNRAIRTIIRAFVNQSEAQARAMIDAAEAELAEEGMQDVG